MRKADGFILVYDVTNKKTLNEIQTIYEEICRIKDSEIFPKILIGNKCDISESERGEKAVSFDFGKKFSIGINSSFLETSALKRYNIDECFNNIIEQVYKIKYKKNEKQELKKRAIYIRLFKR